MATDFLPRTARSGGRFPSTAAQLIKSVDLGTSVAAAIRAPAPQSEPTHGYRDPGEVVLFAFHTSGAIVTSSGRENHFSERGGMSIADMSRIDSFRTTADYSAISLRIASPLVRVSSREMDSLARSPLRLDEPLPRLLASMCREALSSDGTLGKASVVALNRSILDLSAALLDDLLDRQSPPETVRQAVVVRARKHISVHFSQPGLTPHSIASALRISVRTLHKAFESEPETVADAIQASRLAHAAYILIHGPGEILVEDIAYQCGFSTPSGFSRAFRTQYGVSPRQCRMEARGSEGQGAITLQTHSHPLPADPIGRARADGTPGGRDRS